MAEDKDREQQDRDREREQREQRAARVHQHMLAYEKDRREGTRKVKLQAHDVIRLLAQHGRARDAEELERFNEVLGEGGAEDSGRDRGEDKGQARSFQAGQVKEQR